MSQVFSSLFLCCSIQALLSAPNPDDPLAENVARHWKENEVEAVATGWPLLQPDMGKMTVRRDTEMIVGHALLQQKTGRGDMRRREHDCMSDFLYNVGVY